MSAERTEIRSSGSQEKGKLIRRNSPKKYRIYKNRSKTERGIASMFQQKAIIRGEIELRILGQNQRSIPDRFRFKMRSFRKSQKIMIFRIGSSKVGLRRQKIKFFDFQIAPKRVLTCGFERARRELPESSIISEKGANHVELWSKHSQKRNLVRMLYMTL